jgi:hypothetical protein
MIRVKRTFEPVSLEKWQGAGLDKAEHQMAPVLLIFWSCHEPAAQELWCM